ncbi:MAG TPA: carboxymuconolactone decarboxylase family protein [Flexivirga sp.]|uniref:carboxymuconolactone decarboxylase family protein n=1 Tax=Flexivirga sp. TaxID=1962927 RepID=UPI002C37BB81|nr:carboxymuconolactone decarboxylase family protein [Flexivirga sp.]HWC21132.1 carboxymuconolactone decarboxylase family protein [Flexivirga sp.]
MTERFDFGATAGDAFRACLALPKYVKSCDLDWGLQELIKIRASMVNGCATCIDGHTADAAAHGETLRRIASLAAWKEAACYSAKERAALAFTDEMTLISQGGVSDAVWDEMTQHFSDREIADVMAAVIAINVFNRLTITTHQLPEDLRAPARAS